MHRIAGVTEHEGRRQEGRSLAARRGNASEEETLQQRPAGAGILAHEVEHDVAVVGEQAAGYRPGHAGEQLHQGLPEGQGDEQGGEGEGAAEQAVVEDGHLDHHPPQPLGSLRGRLEGGVGAE